jgi:hypothetical protein
MALRVLTGLEATVARWRPSMFVEVESNNAAAFEEWLKLQQRRSAGDRPTDQARPRPRGQVTRGSMNRERFG